MKDRITLLTAIKITKYATAPILCWPLPVDASSSQILRRNIFSVLAVLHLITCSIPSFYKVYHNLGDTDIVVRVTAEAGALLAVAVKMMTCKMVTPHLQKLMSELQGFVKQATKQEMRLIQDHVDRCLFFHGVILISSCSGSLAFIVGPVFTPQPLPGDTAYPFSIEPFWIWALLYFSQIIIIVQVGCMGALDCMYAILMWFSVSKFEMLAIKLERATNYDDLRLCIQEHQTLLKHMQVLQDIVCRTAVQVSTLTLIGITSGGFVIIRNPPAYVLAKFIFYDIVAAMELFLYAWPADGLKDMGERIGFAAYISPCMGQSSKMTSSVLIIMQKSADPLKFAVSGLLPELSLRYFGTVISAGVSYMTTLRAVAANQD